MVGFTKPACFTFYKLSIQYYSFRINRKFSKIASKNFFYGFLNNKSGVHNIYAN